MSCAPSKTKPELTIYDKDGGSKVLVIFSLIDSITHHSLICPLIPRTLVINKMLKVGDAVHETDCVTHRSGKGRFQQRRKWQLLRQL